MYPYIKRKIIKIHGSSSGEIEDSIAVEKKLKITINGKDFISLYCTPIMIRELITGLFLTECIFTEMPTEISIVYGNELLVDIMSNEVISTDDITTARRVGGITYEKKRKIEKIENDFSLNSRYLLNIFNEFQQRSDLFSLTGCFHIAALSNGEKILAFAEDIGRHNAVDKVIGYSILNNISFNKKLLLVSCRLSSEIISKCSRWGIPIVASRAAPTTLAIEIAERSGITLIGFIRGERMNIYTNPQRIYL
ncbi:MAG: formate dehydrogenase accessory sulfurtransferase FdhD [Nitrospirae bacterium]|nr:formate dehydrogenase accessory sulfurtransferase FdhD [Nitrospirota bacterium]